jgi:hypothetical protein
LPCDLRRTIHRRAFTADTWWGIAGFLWIATGLWRLLVGTEKPTGYHSLTITSPGTRWPCWRR